MNPNTIQKAYAELERRGFIYTVKGRGNFVLQTMIILLTESGEIRQKVDQICIEAEGVGIKRQKIADYILGEGVELMIELINLNKSFDGLKAVDNISVNIKEGNVFGLIGTNGAGKSTVLRLLTGVIKPDSGKVIIDGEEVYNNVSAKSKFFFISDDQYFFSTANAVDMEKYSMHHFTAVLIKALFMNTLHVSVLTQRER